MLRRQLDISSRRKISVIIVVLLYTPVSSEFDKISGILSLGMSKMAESVLNNTRERMWG
jgi:hypothetical protein